MSLENDVTQIKQIVERDIFNPASPGDITHRETARKKELAAKKAARKGVDFCPHCGVDLREENNGVYTKGSVDFEQMVFWNTSNNTWDWGEKDYGNDTAEGFFCNRCNKELIREDDFDREDTL